MFTKEQEKIIHSEDQHINVIANAGTGKSTVIVERVANLVLNKNVSPERIYLTSFSRVANKELQEKIFKRIGYEGNKITIKTIHGFCFHVIINNLDWFGYSKLDIIDVYRYERLVKSVMYQLGMINEETKESEILEYAVMFNKIKLNMNTDSLKGDMKHFFNEVEKLKKEQEKMTYEDLLVNTYVILSENEKIREEYQNYYDHIIIDECLPYYIPVHLGDGSYRFIGDIVENKERLQVLSYNENTGKQEICEITGWRKIPNQKTMVKISCESLNTIGGKKRTNFVVCTIDHKLFTYNKGWVEAGKLKKDDILQIESDAFKNKKYKITDKGKKHLSNLMHIDNKAKKNSLKGNKVLEKKGYKKNFKERGGNGKGYTKHQKFLYDEINTKIGGCWEMEGVVVTGKKMKELYNSPHHYKIDIFNETEKICIEIDGKSHYSKERKLQDLKKEKVLKDLGYTIIRYRNEDIFKKIDLIIDEIKKLNISKNCIFKSKVISVDFASTKEDFVYDITVDRCHNFYANGILVHNCQDTDKLQFMIIELLLNVKTNTVIVGDAKQNIYGFRGASYKHSDEFSEKLNSVIYPLSETFRFGQPISDLSNKIMEYMDIKDEYKIPTVTNVDIKNKPSFNLCSYTTCIMNICDDIEEKIRQGYKYKDLHVLYRINRLSNEIQKELSRRRIPYIVQKGSFVNRKEIKFLMNILQLYFFFDKSLFIEFIQSYSNGIDKKSIEKVYKEVEDKNNTFSFLDTAISKEIEGIGKLKRKIFGKISDYFLELDKIINSEPFNKPSFFIDIANIFEIENTKFMINVKSNTGESMIEERWEFITDFQSIYTQYDGSLKDFNNYLKVMFLNDASDGKEKDAVCLKTIHGSKGQTCPVMYLLGYKIADPYFTTSESDVLSELFLLYVGVTRARDYLYFYHDSLDDFLLSFIFPEKEEDYNSNLGKILDNSSENTDTTKERKEDNNTHVDDYEKAQLSRNIKKDYEPLHENFIPVKTTPKAILFQDKVKFLSVWLPKSQMGYHENVYYCASWLMKKNSLY